MAAQAVLSSAVFHGSELFLRLAPTGAIIDSPSVKTTERGGPSGHDDRQEGQGTASVQDREVSKVFADGGTRGDTLRDRLKELTLPDIPEIVASSRVVARPFARRGDAGGGPGTSSGARSVPWPGYSASPAASSCPGSHEGQGPDPQEHRHGKDW